MIVFHNGIGKALNHVSILRETAAAVLSQSTACTIIKKQIILIRASWILQYTKCMTQIETCNIIGHSLVCRTEPYKWQCPIHYWNKPILSSFPPYRIIRLIFIKWEDICFSYADELLWRQGSFVELVHVNQNNHRHVYQQYSSALYVYVLEGDIISYFPPFQIYRAQFTVQIDPQSPTPTPFQIEKVIRNQWNVIDIKHWKQTGCDAWFEYG